ARAGARRSRLQCPRAASDGGDIAHARWRPWHRPCSGAPRADRGRAMLIQVLLAANDADAGETTVSTTVHVDTADPRWPARLVDAVAGQAAEGARRLCDQLTVRPAIPGDGFIPLAAVVSAAELGR